MKPGTKLGVDLTTEQYKKDLINTATSVAVKAHIAGDLQAHTKLGIPIAENLVQQEALEYGKTYRDKLLKDGSSIINGKDVKWLNNQVESTRLDVYNVIEQGLKEGKPVASIGGKHIAPGTIAHDLEQLAIRDKQYEYARIARTETARIQNQGTLNRFNKNDITYVEVVDGDGCDACAEANGQIWTIEYAMSHELEHPNCVRAFIPVIPNDWEPPELPDEADIKLPNEITAPKDVTKVLKVPKTKLVPKADEIKEINTLEANVATRKYMDDLIKLDEERAEELFESIKDYTYMEFDIINQGLRNPDSLFRYGFNRRLEIRTNTTNISKFLTNAPKVEGTVYRGMTFDDSLSLKTFINQMKTHDQTLLESFTSTSVSKSVAEEAFIAEKTKRKFSAILEIESKTGVYLGDASAWETELEVLFNHHTKFAIKNVEEITESSYKIILKEIID